MTTHRKIQQGTTEWFEMVGTLMSEAALQAGLSSDLNVSLVERYTDGAELSEGLVQGIHFAIVAGKPYYRVGAGQDEMADIIIEVTAAAARELNLLHSADSEYVAARDEFLRTSEMRIEGDISRLGAWLEAVHDPIVDRTK